MSVPPRAAAPCVALLRGVNVGGRAALPMAGLRDLVASLGHADVRTYLQSGNVVLSPATAGAAALERQLEAAIAERFGLDTRVLVRTAAQLEAVVDANPFPAALTDPASVHVLFLARTPAADAVARLDPSRSPTDAFEVRGREVFVHYPHGAGRSRFTGAYVERVLGVAATGRNWRTVTALLAMTRPA
ncbi:MAG: DUF1697 domain-containing protein [Actinomycetota bacterium]